MLARDFPSLTSQAPEDEIKRQDPKEANHSAATESSSSSWSVNVPQHMQYHGTDQRQATAPAPGRGMISSAASDDQHYANEIDSPQLPGNTGHATTRGHGAATAGVPHPATASSSSGPEHPALTSSSNGPELPHPPTPELTQQIGFPAFGTDPTVTIQAQPDVSTSAQPLQDPVLAASATMNKEHEDQGSAAMTSMPVSSQSVDFGIDLGHTTAHSLPGTSIAPLPGQELEYFAWPVVQHSGGSSLAGDGQDQSDGDVDLRCGLKLAQPGNAVRHLQTQHPGVRPYCCRVCGATFLSLFKMVKHRRVAHGIDAERPGYVNRHDIDLSVAPAAAAAARGEAFVVAVGTDASSAGGKARGSRRRKSSFDSEITMPTPVWTGARGGDGLAGTGIVTGGRNDSGFGTSGHVGPTITPHRFISGVPERPVEGLAAAASASRGSRQRRAVKSGRSSGRRRKRSRKAAEFSMVDSDEEHMDSDMEYGVHSMSRKVARSGSAGMTSALAQLADTALEVQQQEGPVPKGIRLLQTATMLSGEGSVVSLAQLMSVIPPGYVLVPRASVLRPGECAAERGIIDPDQLRYLAANHMEVDEARRGGSPGPGIGTVTGSATATVTAATTATTTATSTATADAAIKSTSAQAGKANELDSDEIESVGDPGEQQSSTKASQVHEPSSAAVAGSTTSGTVTSAPAPAPAPAPVAVGVSQSYVLDRLIFTLAPGGSMTPVVLPVEAARVAIPMQHTWPQGSQPTAAPNPALLIEQHANDAADRQMSLTSTGNSASRPGHVISTSAATRATTSARPFARPAVSMAASTISAGLRQDMGMAQMSLFDLADARAGSGINQTNRPRKWECPTCDRKFRSSSNLKRHRQTVHGQSLTRTCFLCAARFCDEHDLGLHLTSKHGITIIEYEAEFGSQERAGFTSQTSPGDQVFLVKQSNRSASATPSVSIGQASRSSVEFASPAMGGVTSLQTPDPIEASGTTGGSASAADSGSVPRADATLHSASVAATQQPATAAVQHSTDNKPNVVSGPHIAKSSEISPGGSEPAELTLSNNALKVQGRNMVAELQAS